MKKFKLIDFFNEITKLYYEIKCQTKNFFMIYHVIIALNSVGKRNVGDIISIVEQHGLELCEIRRKVKNLTDFEYPDLKLLILKSKLDDLEEMNFFKEKFSTEVLNRKINHFINNHVELFFENNGDFINPHLIWKDIYNNIFHNKKPLLFVTIDSAENGINTSFIPDPFEPDGNNRLDFRTLIPLHGK